MAKPFLKWAGGKAQLFDAISSRKPTNYTRYVEPMVGGGAVLFNLMPETALISDINEELINVYLQIKTNYQEVLVHLRSIGQGAEEFYAMRASDRESDFAEWEPAKRAARTIYLNKLGYNGLYRVNSSGKFNVPYGKRTGVNFNEEEFAEASRVLQRCDIRNQTYSEICDSLTAGDWAYIDPPYVPSSETSNFTQYTSTGFDWSEHLKLKKCCDDMTERGVKFLLSNSHCMQNLQLYSGYNISVVFARRSINSNASRRGPVPEILVSNY